MMLDLKRRNENLKGRILIKSHQRQRVRNYQQLEDFHQQQQSHAMRSGLLSSKSQSLGQMVVKKAIGMDDDVFENEDDAEGGG